MKAYEQSVRETLARTGHIGRYNPGDVLAWMYAENGTLDSLSKAKFAREVEQARVNVDAADPAITASLARSYGCA